MQHNCIFALQSVIQSSRSFSIPFALFLFFSLPALVPDEKTTLLWSQNTNVILLLWLVASSGPTGIIRQRQEEKLLWAIEHPWPHSNISSIAAFQHFFDCGILFVPPTVSSPFPLSVANNQSHFSRLPSSFSSHFFLSFSSFLRPPLRLRSHLWTTDQTSHRTLDSTRTSSFVKLYPDAKLSLKVRNLWFLLIFLSTLSFPSLLK